jgi:hypothetical protein
MGHIIELSQYGKMQLLFDVTGQKLFLAVWECFNEQVTKMWVKEKFLFCCS